MKKSCVCINTVLMRGSSSLVNFVINEFLEYEYKDNLYYVKGIIFPEKIFKTYFADLGEFREDRLDKVINNG